MNNFKEILINHLNKYPLMQAEDIYKLAYQHVFGPAHFVSDKEKVMNYLFIEAKEIETKDIEVVDIGNGYYRYSLINDENYLRELGKAFINTANENKNSDIDFDKFLDEIINDLKELKINFDINDFLKLKEKMKEYGYSAISHSDLYRKTYQPHYRLIKGKL